MKNFFEKLIRERRKSRGIAPMLVFEEQAGVDLKEHIMLLTDDLVSLDKLVQKIKKKCEEAIKTYDNEEFYEDEIETFLAEKNFAEEILEMIQEWED